MARKKKSKGNLAMATPMSGGGSERLSTDISAAENGYIVNVSGETGGKKSEYFSKRFIASDRADALRIASSGLSGTSHKGSKKKSGNKKKISLKRG